MYHLMSHGDKTCVYVCTVCALYCLGSIRCAGKCRYSGFLGDIPFFYVGQFLGLEIGGVI